MSHIPRAFAQLPSATVRGGQASISGRPTAPTVDVTARTPDCGPPINDEHCSTTWVEPVGDTRPLAPWDAPCSFERSDYVVLGRKKMSSVATSCRLVITGPDVPSNDLGTLSGFRSVCAAAQGIGQGANTPLLLNMAALMTFDFSNLGVDPVIGVGWYLKIAYNLAQTPAPTIRIQTGGTAVGGAGWQTVLGSPVSRNVALEMLANCPVTEIFLPSMRQQGNGAIGFPVEPPFAPVAVTVPQAAEPAAGSSTLIVTGLPAGIGQVTAHFVGPNSPLLPRIFGFYNNA